jgi:Eukaryotic-type carbonic anhydrase
MPEEGPAAPTDPTIDPSRLLPAQRGYYQYEGSLTTPPCSETVDWIVLAQPIEVDEADITRLDVASVRPAFEGSVAGKASPDCCRYGKQRPNKATRLEGDEPLS